MQKKWDVIVIGGGTAGVIAAIQSSLAGARTLLVEKTGLLGGTITTAGIDFPGLFHAWKRQVIAGIGWELVQSCAAECGIPLPNPKMQDPNAHPLHHIQINRALYSAICDEALLKAGTTIQLHAMVASVEQRGGVWKTTLCTKSGLSVIESRVVIDASGDANAATLAGCATITPPEVQPGTLVCHASGYDPATIDYEALRVAFEAEVGQGRLKQSDIGWNLNRFDPKWVRKCGENSSHVIGINAGSSEGKTSMELEARAALLRLYRFLRRQPGLENLHLDYVAPECGVRETVTIVGKATVTVEDYVSGRLWDDAVCHSFYPIDLHMSSGKGLDCRPLAEGVVPTIPRGAMLPVGTTNLIVAGRCISSDRAANSALRAQASCMAMGQAAGAMAALTALSGTEVEQLALQDIRSTLRQYGAIVPEAGIPLVEIAAGSPVMMGHGLDI